MTTTFDPDSLEEYHEAAQYAEDRFGVGRQFVADIQGAIAGIEKDPTRFQPVGDGIRIFRMKRFPYYLFYHYDESDQTIMIYALAHHKRQQDYWRDRLPGQ